MVDVEQRTLCAFSQHVLAFGECTVDFDFGVGEVELTHIVHTLEPLLFFLGDVVVGEVEILQNLFVACLECSVFGFESVEDVTHAQTYTCSLVAIGRANALTRGAHLVLALGGLVGAVEHTMGGENQMGALADVQTLGQLIASCLQLVGFCHEEVGGNHATIADDVHLALVEDAGGNGTEHEFLAIEDDGVAGIGAASKTGYHVVTRGEIVDHFAFAFVAENDTQKGIHFSFSHSCIWGISSRYSYWEVWGDGMLMRRPTDVMTAGVRDQHLVRPTKLVVFLRNAPFLLPFSHLCSMISPKTLQKAIRKHFRWLLLLVVAGVLAALYFIRPTDYEWVPKCMFRQLTGFDCPGCGLQRAAHAALHGQWAEAWAYNRFLIYSLPYLLCVMVAEWFSWGRVQQWMRRVFEGRKALWIYLVLYVTWGVARNVMGC